MISNDSRTYRYRPYLLLQCQLDDSVVASKYHFFSSLWNYLCRFVDNDEAAPPLLGRLGNIVLMMEFEGLEEYSWVYSGPKSMADAVKAQSSPTLETPSLTRLSAFAISWLATSKDCRDW